MSVVREGYCAPRGTELQCLGWEQEAALRMLLNNLDAEVAERPEELIVYGGRGKAARSTACLEGILSALRVLPSDYSLIVQSGKAVGILPTQVSAPRVLISNAQLVPRWATWDKFNELERKGLTMYGQMTAGSWIYIGSQGIVQGTYETCAALADRHFGGSLEGRLCVTAGLGGMGGAQPLAITMNRGVALVAEVERWRIEKRIETRYLDEYSSKIDEAIDRALEAKASKKPLSIGVHANIVHLLSRLLEREVEVDVLTDQTSAHDPLVGYVPHTRSVEEAATLRNSDPKSYLSEVYASILAHVKHMLSLQKRGAITFDYGNNLRTRAYEQGLEEAFNFPGFVPEYIRPLFCEGKGPFRWVALSGDPRDIQATDEALLELFPNDRVLHRWMPMAQERIAFQGLPARICWLGLGARAEAGLLFNKMVRDGRLTAPIVIGRDHLDAGSVASPYRETERMKDGSDAIADWPILNALVATAGGASWVSLHHGGGVGIGDSIHAGMVVVADGSELAEARLRRVLHNDPAMGVLRHLDAGYELAQRTAQTHKISLNYHTKGS